MLGFGMASGQRGQAPVHRIWVPASPLACPPARRCRHLAVLVTVRAGASPQAPPAPDYAATSHHPRSELRAMPQPRAAGGRAAARRLRRPGARRRHGGRDQAGRRGRQPAGRDDRGACEEEDAAESGELRPDEIATLRAWIDAGAAYSELPLPPLDDKVPALTQQAAVLPQVTGLAYRPDGGELAVGGYREVRRLATAGTAARHPSRVCTIMRAVATAPTGRGRRPRAACLARSARS